MSEKHYATYSNSQTSVMGSCKILLINSGKHLEMAVSLLFNTAAEDSITENMSTVIV